METDLELEAKKLSAKAKDVARDGDLKLSLELFEKAYKLFPSEKIKNRIAKLQVFCVLSYFVFYFFILFCTFLFQN